MYQELITRISTIKNNQNATQQKDNKCGHKHIYFKTHTIKGKEYSYWCVDIKHNYEWVCRTKRFKTLEEAINHRDKILKELNREIIQ